MFLSQKSSFSLNISQFNFFENVFKSAIFNGKKVGRAKKCNFGHNVDYRRALITPYSMQLVCQASEIPFQTRTVFYVSMAKNKLPSACLLFLWQPALRVCAKISAKYDQLAFYSLSDETKYSIDYCQSYSVILRFSHRSVI